MSAAIAILPTEAAVGAAWDRYAELMREMVATPDLALDPSHCQRVAIAWEEWRDLFLARRAK